MKKQTLLTLFFLIPFILISQNPAKKTMDYHVYDIWTTIKEPKISNDGKFIAYRLQPDKGDPTLTLYYTQTGETRTYDRGENVRFSNNSAWMAFKIKPFQDSIRTMKRRKVKKDSLPPDTLAIVNLSNGNIRKFTNLKNFEFPKKWDGALVYQSTAVKQKNGEKKDSKAQEGKKKKKAKKHNDKNGFPLIVYQLNTLESDTFDYVTDYTLSEEGGQLLFASTGKDSTFEQGVYKFDFLTRKLTPLIQRKGKYAKLTWDKKGEQAAFVADLDTSKPQIKPYELWVWQKQNESARVLTKPGDNFLPDDWLVSNTSTPRFSEDGQQLYFGIAPPPMVKDTTLLEDEIVKVEVWSATDMRLHTQQKVQLKRDKNKAYTCVWHTATNQLFQLADEELPRVDLELKTKTDMLVGINELPYQMMLSWEGFPVRKDVYLVNTKNGARKLIVKNLKGNPDLSPSGKYVYWFNRVDTTWNSYHIASGKSVQLTSNKLGPFYEELHDLPQLPGETGRLGWTKDDQYILIYDRFDIWKMDPQGKESPQRLTKGREQQMRYRYIRLDREERFLQPDHDLLLYTLNDETKAQGYARYNLKTGQLRQLIEGDFQLSRRPVKARDTEDLFFTKENFQIFPDLLLSNTDFSKQKQISNANPQQSEYSWGSIELIEWTAHDGQQLQGLLAKPENFDPNKKYPMIVNFYERSSDRLHRHRHPFPHRSTINYTYYTNRGYVIFNPDVPYRIGYPGESAYNSVMSGVTHLIDKGFIDKERIALQGHSWGGYQVAYLATKTKMFRCIESGAPVVNMTSAYGGIRWGSGLSRMFQYENSQSRIGGTLWEYPVRYIENSPLFFIDKIETPILILHNDKDGAVPWYQGIEFFIAMRRLGKPAWLLNYNDEPHWPVKRQNRLDFNRRMEQFFDYYLKDAPMPVWMERGVPAMEVGIEQGLEYIQEED